jgi:hypothetical protein
LIIPILASQVARIIGVGHWCRVLNYSWYLPFLSPLSSNSPPGPNDSASQMILKPAHDLHLFYYQSSPLISLLPVYSILLCLSNLFSSQRRKWPWYSPKNPNKILSRISYPLLHVFPSARNALPPLLLIQVVFTYPLELSLNGILRELRPVTVSHSSWFSSFQNFF